MQLNIRTELNTFPTNSNLLTPIFIADHYFKIFFLINIKTGGFAG